MGTARIRWRFAIVVILILVIAGLLFVRAVWYPGRAFDAAKWNDDTQIERGVRLAMADRLVARRTLIGKIRSEVVSLLGEPPPTGYFASWDMVYHLGPERGFMSVDSEWLVLKMGAEARVIECRIVRD